MSYQDQLIEKWKSIYPIFYKLKCKGCNKALKTLTAIRCACNEVFFCNKECVTNNSPEHYTCTLRSKPQLIFTLHPAVLNSNVNNYMILKEFGSIVVDIKLIYYGYNIITKSVCKVYYLANGIVVYDSGINIKYRIPQDEEDLNKVLEAISRIVDYVNKRNLNKKLINIILNKLLPDGKFTTTRPEFSIDSYSDKYKIAFILEYDESLINIFNLRGNEDLKEINDNIENTKLIYVGYKFYTIKSENIVKQISDIVYNIKIKSELSSELKLRLNNEKLSDLIFEYINGY